MFKSLLKLAKPAICAYLLFTSGNGAELVSPTNDGSEEVGITAFPSQACTMIIPPPKLARFSPPSITPEAELIGSDQHTDSIDENVNA